MKHYELLIMAPFFVVLLMEIHEPVKEVFNFDSIGSWVFSVCISALGMIGINHFFKDSIEVILLAYATMVIAILAMSLFRLFNTLFKGAKEGLSDCTINEEDTAQKGHNQLKRQQNVYRK